MIDDVKITIPGEPVPQGRPRFTRSGHAYDPEKSHAYKAAVALLARRAMKGNEPMDGAVGCYIEFTHTIPKSFTKGKRLAARYGMYAKATRPDIDNLAKGVMDAIKGIVWRDDAQVTTLSLRKRYGDEPGVLVRVWADTHIERYEGDNDDD